eukprot:766506-Hanusia_phi.AAC.1
MQQLSAEEQNNVTTLRDSVAAAKERVAQLRAKLTAAQTAREEAVEVRKRRVRVEETDRRLLPAASRARVFCCLDGRRSSEGGGDKAEQHDRRGRDPESGWVTQTLLLLLLLSLPPLPPLLRPLIL